MNINFPVVLSLPCNNWDLTFFSISLSLKTKHFQHPPLCTIPLPLCLHKHTINKMEPVVHTLLFCLSASYKLPLSLHCSKKFCLSNNLTSSFIIVTLTIHHSPPFCKWRPGLWRGRDHWLRGWERMWKRKWKMKWKRRMKVVLVSQKKRKREALVAIVVPGEEGQVGVVEGFLHLLVKQRGVVLIWLMQKGTIAAIRSVSFTPKHLLLWLQGWGRGFASNVAGFFIHLQHFLFRQNFYLSIAF